MKKVLALVLAVVLAFGMATVAFAAPSTKANDVVIFSNLYTISSDYLKDVDGTDLRSNTTYYYEVAYAKSEASDAKGLPFMDSGMMSKISTYSALRIRTDVTDGAGYISSRPAFVVKGVKGFKDKDGKITETFNAGKKVNTALVSFTTANKFNKEAADLNFSFDVYKGGDIVPSFQFLGSMPFNGSVGYGTKDAAGSFTVPKDGAIVNFEGQEKVEAYFGDTDVHFDVDAKDQKDLYLRLVTKDDALTEKFPDADLKIYKFEGNNKTFRRTGKLVIPADMVENKDGKMVAPVLYNYESGKLTVNKDAKYNSDASCFEIKTNKLGNYVVSAQELKVAEEPATDAPVDPVAPGTPGTAVPNPDTGANDFVGLAVALAVVSVAGIAVAKRK
ncbi:MAG: hypothetical protein RR639_05280 [Hydrogenoanaerobacterium sp.]